MPGVLLELTLLFHIQKLLDMVSNKLLPNRTDKYTPLKLTLVSIGILLLTITGIIWPFVFIWSLNTLFALSIPFTFYTWLAASIILTVFSGVPRVSNRSKE